MKISLRAPNVGMACWRNGFAMNGAFGGNTPYSLNRDFQFESEGWANLAWDDDRTVTQYFNHDDETP